MDAQNHLCDIAVSSDGKSVMISGLEITDPEAVAYLVTAVGTGAAHAAEAAVRALAVGAAVLQRVEARGDAEYLRAQAAQVILRIEQDMLKLKSDFEKSVRDSVAPDVDGSIGKTMVQRFDAMQKSLNDAVTSARQELDKRREDLQKNLETTFAADGRIGGMLKEMSVFEQKVRAALDPSNHESHLGKLMVEFRKVFDDKSGTLPALLDQRLAFDRDGSPFSEFRKRVEAQIQELHGAVDVVRAAVMKEEQVQEAEAAGTRKGFAFEDELEEKLQKLARPNGDEVTRVSTRGEAGGAKVGDFVVALAPAAGRVVIEAKDEPMESLPAWKGILQEAMRVRDSQYAVLVVRSADQLQQQVGAWNEYEGDKLFTSADLLEVALKWARLRIAQSRSNAPDGIDVPALEVELDRARSAIKGLTEAKKQSSAIDKANKALRERLDDAQTAVTEALDAAAATLRTAPSGAGQAGSPR